jgi:hypothetical protein
MDETDELVSVLPIHYNDSLAHQLQVHQFPLLTRPLQAPPSAVLSGKRITARYKPNARRFEVHVPVDTRPEVYNVEKSKDLGIGRLEDDREKNQERNTREDEDPRLTEVRLRSEEIPQRSAQVLGIVKGGKYCRETCLIPPCNIFFLQGNFTFTLSAKFTNSGQLSPTWISCLEKIEGAVEQALIRIRMRDPLLILMK